MVCSAVGMHVRFDVSVALTLIMSIFLTCQKCTNSRTEFLTPRLIYLFIFSTHPYMYTKKQKTKALSSYSVEEI